MQNLQIKDIGIGLSSYLRSLFKNWSNDELVTRFVQAHSGKGIFEGIGSSKLSTVKRCFQGEFKRRGIILNIV